MAKAKTVFYCTECGNESPKWQGRCAACGAWNTLVEHVEKPVAVGRAKSAPVGISRTPQKLSQIHSDTEIRFSTGMGELDRVLGGGAVAGSLVLVGGAPGIGKSTLLLQICKSLCNGRKVLYVSGEESEKQLKMRAQRIGTEPDDLFVLSETRLSDILEAAESVQPGQRRRRGQRPHASELNCFPEHGKTYAQAAGGLPAVSDCQKRSL